MIKAVVFDYFGVIGGAEKTGTTKRVADYFGVTEDEVKKFMGAVISDFRAGRISEKEMFFQMSKALGKPISKSTDYLYRQGFREKFVIFPEMVKFVKELKAKGLKVGVLSNTVVPFVEIVNDMKGFEDFDVVINSCEVGFSKPDPRIYKLTLEKLDLLPEEVVFVDDREENVVAANNLGMRGVIYTGIEDLKTEIGKFNINVR